MKDRIRLGEQNGFCAELRVKPGDRYIRTEVRLGRKDTENYKEVDLDSKQSHTL